MLSSAEASELAALVRAELAARPRSHAAEQLAIAQRLRDQLVAIAAASTAAQQQEHVAETPQYASVGILTDREAAVARVDAACEALPVACSDAMEQVQPDTTERAALAVTTTYDARCGPDAAPEDDAELIAALAEAERCRRELAVVRRANDELRAAAKLQQQQQQQQQQPTESNAENGGAAAASPYRDDELEGLREALVDAERNALQLRETVATLAVERNRLAEALRVQQQQQQQQQKSVRPATPPPQGDGGAAARRIAELEAEGRALKDKVAALEYVCRTRSLEPTATVHARLLSRNQELEAQLRGVYDLLRAEEKRLSIRAPPTPSKAGSESPGATGSAPTSALDARIAEIMRRLQPPA